MAIAVGPVMANTIARTFGPCLAAGVLFFAPPAAALQPRNEHQFCAPTASDTAITSCTRAIESGRYQGAALSMLYYNRGLLWRSKTTTIVRLPTSTR